MSFRSLVDPRCSSTGSGGNIWFSDLSQTRLPLGYLYEGSAPYRSEFDVKMKPRFKLPGTWRHTQRCGASITPAWNLMPSTRWPGTRCREAIGGLLSFELSGGYAAGNTFINTMELPARAVSFGGFESLATQPAAMWSGAIGDDAAVAAGIAPGLIRFAVGLEHPADVLEDFDRTLSNV